jgi:Histidine kinase
LGARLGALGLFFLVAASAQALVLAEEVRWTRSDSVQFAAPEFNDVGWQTSRFWELPESDGVLWVRTAMEVRPEDRLPGHPFAVTIGAMASHELYWDGELVGRGGVVGVTPEAERPGPVEALYALPERLTGPATHTVAVRFSAHHRGWEPFTGYWFLAGGDYGRLLLAQRRSAETALVALSGIVMMAIFAFALWLLDRRERSSLLLALLCVTAAALLWAESWRALFGYTYDWQIVRLRVVTSLAWLLVLGLLAFLAQRFPMRGRRWLVGGGALLAALPIAWYRAWDPKALVALLVGFSLGLLWTVVAMRRRLPGAALAFAGLVICAAALLWRPGLFIDQNLYLALNALFLLLLAAHARQVTEGRREREAAEVRSARLEVELLKRQLQPHFLMNTLTALSEWLEEDPPTAAAMIQALGDELRLLGEISDQRLIPLGDELRLCRSHLEVMSLRTESRYRLEVTGDRSGAGDEGVKVPPAMLHTLVENAVTHGDAGPPAGSEIVLRLSIERVSDPRRGRHRHRRFVFEAPLALGDLEAPAVEGTGLRYVRARLRESFGEEWSLAAGPDQTPGGGVWRTEIEIPEPLAEPRAARPATAGAVEPAVG